MRGILVTVFLFASAGALGLAAHVYTLPEQALNAEFPEAKIERQAKYLTKAQQRFIEEQPGLDRVGRFHTFYVARGTGGMVAGYATFDTHRVRTKDQTLFIALNADGSIRNVRVVSFFEPEDYLAPDRWLALFSGKRATEHALLPGKDLPAITGATMTTRAVSNTVRKVLFLYKAHYADR